MKIYVITFDDVDDYATLHHDIEAFGNYEDAKKRFDEIVLDAKNLLDEGGNDDWEREESEHQFESWPDGNWGTDHYGVYLNEVEVQ